MVDNVALQVQPLQVQPNTGFVNSLLAASQIRNADTQNQLAQFGLQEHQDEKNALANYSQRNAANDPNSLDALSSHPKLMGQMAQVRGSLDAQRRERFDFETTNKGRAAAAVLSLPPDQQEAAFKEQLENGLRGGWLTPEGYKMALSKPFNPLALRQIALNGMTADKILANERSDQDRETGKVFVGGLTRAYGGGGQQAGATPPPGVVASTGGGNSLGGIPGFAPGERLLGNEPPAPAPGSAPAVTMPPATAPRPTAPMPAQRGAQGPVTLPPQSIAQSDKIPLLIAAAGSPGVPESVQKLATELLKNEFKDTKILDETKQRLATAISMGLDPMSPTGQSFVLTGKMPREDQQNLTATDKKAINEAEDHIVSHDTALQMLNEAKGQSKKAWGFKGAGGLAVLGAPFNQGAADTAQLDKLVATQAVEHLKSIFGGNPTEGERKILLDISGSSSLPDSERQKIYDRAIGLVERKRVAAQQRVDELRGGTYYKPGGGSTPAPATVAAPPPAIIDHLRLHPDTADKFDARYGAGSAAKYLGK